MKIKDFLRWSFWIIHRYEQQRTLLSKGCWNTLAKLPFYLVVRWLGMYLKKCESVARSLLRSDTTAGDCLKLIEKLKNSHSKIISKLFQRNILCWLCKKCLIQFHSKNTPLSFRYTNTEEDARSVINDRHQNYFKEISSADVVQFRSKNTSLRFRHTTTEEEARSVIDVRHR